MSTLGFGRQRRLAAATCLAAAAVIAGACSGGGATAPAAVSPGSLSFVIRVSDNVFTPKNLTVPPGTSVTWEWSGKNRHSVIGQFGGQDVHSPTHQGSGELTLTFHSIGAWHYQCGVYGQAMSGNVTVQ